MAKLRHLSVNELLWAFSTGEGLDEPPYSYPGDGAPRRTPTPTPTPTPAPPAPPAPSPLPSPPTDNPWCRPEPYYSLPQPVVVPLTYAQVHAAQVHAAQVFYAAQGYYSPVHGQSSMGADVPHLSDHHWPCL